MSSFHHLSSHDIPFLSWPLALRLFFFFLLSFSSLFYCCCFVCFLLALCLFYLSHVSPAPPPIVCPALTCHSLASGKHWGKVKGVTTVCACLWGEGRAALSHGSFFFRSSCCPGACPSPGRGLPRRSASGEPQDRCPSRRPGVAA